MVCVAGQSFPCTGTHRVGRARHRRPWPVRIISSSRQAMGEGVLRWIGRCIKIKTEASAWSLAWPMPEQSCSPYSYAGATLSQQPSGPLFDFHTYSGATTAQEPSLSVQRLDDELFSIHQVWHQAHIVVVGHSLGGLIAEQWWRCMVGHCGVPLNHAPAGDARGGRAGVLPGLAAQRLQDDEL
jgi:hypothetical protein